MAKKTKEDVTKWVPPEEIVRIMREKENKKNKKKKDKK